MRPAMEYASTTWSPLASSTSINKLQVMQNTAVRTATLCTQDTNIQHLHDEKLPIPIYEHLQLHVSQYKQKTQHPSHPNTPRLKTLSSIMGATQQTSSRPKHSHFNRHKNKHRHIHTSIVSRHLATRNNNKILHTPPSHISSSEEILPRLTRRSFAQLRTK